MKNTGRGWLLAILYVSCVGWSVGAGSCQSSCTEDCRNCDLLIEAYSDDCYEWQYKTCLDASCGSYHQDKYDCAFTCEWWIAECCVEYAPGKYVFVEYCKHIMATSQVCIP